MIEEHALELQKGVVSWNLWRKNNPDIRPSLRDADFTSSFPNPSNYYSLPSFDNCDFSYCDLHGVSLRNGTYWNCDFDGCDINFADLVDGYFTKCTFRNVNMRVTKIGSAHFVDCLFESSDLSYCSAEETVFARSRFEDSRLEHMSLVKCDFSNVEMNNCRIYATSCWDLNLEGPTQENLVITSDDNDEITVDNLELAQFIYLLINNQKLRSVIDTITSKVVLILGNFSPDRKLVLDNIRRMLRQHDFIPLMFDFEKPNSRNLTETVLTLASMSKFVIADLSSPRSLPHELSVLVPKMQSIRFYPIIREGEVPYGMFVDLQSYNSVSPLRKYGSTTVEQILLEIVEAERR